MEQEKALKAMAGTMTLVSSASSPRMTADLILRATSSPGCYIFSELLYHPNVQTLKSHPEYYPHTRHLQIFAHGTYKDYISDLSLPHLTDVQTLKLRQLSLLSLASNHAALSYHNLQEELSIPSARELEELVIGAIYAGLLSATLDPARQAVCINSVSSLRDIAPGSIPAMQVGLEEWSSRCSTALNQLEQEMQNIRANAAVRVQEKTHATTVLENLVMIERSATDLPTGLHSQVGRRSKRSQEEEENVMDLDEDDDGGEKKRGRKRV